MPNPFDSTALNVVAPQPLPDSSQQLFARARAGDRAAVDALVGRHLPRLLRWASGRLPRWARDVADTADLVHDAIARTLPRLDRISPRHEHALQAYLRQAVTNRIRDQYRRAARQPHTVAISDEHPATGRSPLDAALQHDVAARYHRALERLAPADREVVVARLDLEYSYEQIAFMLGRPSPDAARMAVNRALVRLAHEMTRG